MDPAPRDRIRARHHSAGHPALVQRRAVVWILRRPGGLGRPVVRGGRRTPAYHRGDCRDGPRNDPNGLVRGQRGSGAVH